MPDCHSQPLVSIVIPAWNAADFLPATLETVFAQTWQPCEIIVVDDGSTDRTGQCLAEYGDRITVVSLTNSGGPSRPRNEGIKRSRGEFIAFFDSDDLMEADKLSTAMEVFAAHPDVDLVCSNFRSIDMADQLIDDDYLAEYRDFRQDLQPSSVASTGLLPGAAAFVNLLRANFVGTSSVVCRRDLFDKVGPFIEEMKNSDDVDMWRRIAGNGHDFAFIDRVLHSYRINPDGISSRGARRIPAMIRGLENQVSLCQDVEDRKYIREKVQSLHLERAWAFRQEGERDQAFQSYRAALAIGWSLRGAVGLLKTYVIAPKRDKR
jgi:teichuronic acid biosynthesis glycosyltransferase TuaG